MAIGTNDSIDKYGTPDTLGTSSAAVADGAFSIAADLSTWVNDDDVREASAQLQPNFSVAPDANSQINLFGRMLDISSTNDMDVPDANFQHIYLGSFPLNDVTSAQYIPIDISLPNWETSQNWEFYLENESGQSMPAGWDFIISPKTIGPHA